LTIKNKYLHFLRKMTQEKSIARVTIGNSDTEPIPVTLSDVEQIIGTDVTGATALNSGGRGIKGWLSAIYMFLIGRIPTLVEGRIPVDVSSLSVTVTNTQLEITNDEGNPIPAELIGDSATSIANIEQSIGTDVTGATVPIGGYGLKGWLSGIYLLFENRIPSLVNGRIPVDMPVVSEVEISNNIGNAIPTTLTGATATSIANIEQSIGTDVTGAAVPIGGNGLKGWLSGIYLLFANRIPTLISGMLPVITRNTVVYKTETIQPLEANQQYIGEEIDMTGFTRLLGYTKTDQPGAFFLEYSPDKINWFIGYGYAIDPSYDYYDFIVHTPTQYVRARYNNGGTSQATLAIFLVKLGN
jgi:hypothetical protein